MQILLCEDDSDVRMIMTTILTELGLTVQPVSDGAEALLLLESGEYKFDILITDFNMPRMNGDELVKSVLKMKIQLKKIIMISGRNENSLEIDFLASQHPNISFLPKPLDMEELLKIVSAF